jgi:hypothetical protein
MWTFFQDLWTFFGRTKEHCLINSNIRKYISYQNILFKTWKMFRYKKKFFDAKKYGMKNISCLFLKNNPWMLHNQMFEKKNLVLEKKCSRVQNKCARIGTKRPILWKCCSRDKERSHVQKYLVSLQQVQTSTNSCVRHWPILCR